jgi:CheY-like chemotaxis protein
MIDTAILCVDDEKLVLDSLRIQLSRHYSGAHMLEFAQDAEEGLEVIGELSENGIRTVLVISDWMMPGMKGDEFLKAVQQKYPDVNTMILTGQANEEKLEDLRNSGVTNMVLSKPWNEQELINAINQLLSLL